MAHEFTVEFEAQDGGPKPELRERFGVVASRRLTARAKEGGAYPAAGDGFDFLDAFEGPYVWEMTPEQFEATPPSSVNASVVSVDPAADAGDGPVRVIARVEF